MTNRGRGQEQQAARGTPDQVVSKEQRRRLEKQGQQRWRPYRDDSVRGSQRGLQPQGDPSGVGVTTGQALKLQAETAVAHRDGEGSRHGTCPAHSGLLLPSAASSSPGLLLATTPVPICSAVLPGPCGTGRCSWHCIPGWWQWDAPLPPPGKGRSQLPQPSGLSGWRVAVGGAGSCRAHCSPHLLLNPMFFQKQPF